jgi:hypothetical protein
MSDPHKPFDFSGIVGYPNDIPDDVLDNVLSFQYGDDACAHVKAFRQLINDCDDSPICEDAPMRLFSWTLLVDDGYAGHWFLLQEDNSIKTIREFLHDFLERFGDDQDEIYNELVDDFMEKWKRKIFPDIETTNSDIEIDTSPDPIEELKEIIPNMQYAHNKQCEAINEQFMAMEDQFKIMEVDFTKTYVDYLDPHELELDNEKDKEVQEDISDKSMDESVIHLQEVQEFEFEVVEYLDDSSPHPPPVEPISLKENLDNREENNIMVPLTCSFPTSQPKEEFVHNSGKMEGNFSLSMSYHYEYWLAFHLGSHEQQSIKSLHSLSYSIIWLTGRTSMILGWLFLAKNSKLRKLGKGSSVSHPGQGCFRHLWLHSIQCMDGYNISLTLVLYFNFVFFHLLCDYVLRCIFVS